MAALYNIGDEVVFTIDNTTSDAEKKTITGVIVDDLGNYSYTFDNTEFIPESYIYGLYSDGVEPMVTESLTALNNVRDGELATITANYSEIASTLESNIRALYA